MVMTVAFYMCIQETESLNTTVFVFEKKLD